MAYSQDVDYSPHDDDSFNTWVELGALDPEQQPMIEHSPMRRFTIKFKSSSPEAEAIIHQPLGVLLEHGVPGVTEHGVPGVTEESRITSVVLHHERGLNYKIIRVTANVEQASGDVSLEFDKET
jgi:hypothetical protein